MEPDRKSPHETQAEDFARAAREQRTSLIAEFWDFLKHNKKWWLLPILFFLLGIGLLIALAGTGAAPFIYPLF